MKRPRWLAASFILVRPISDDSFGAAKAAQRPAALKRHRRKWDLPARCHISVRKRSGVLERSFFSVYGLESLKSCASTCASARMTPPSLLQLFPVAFRIRASLQKWVVLQLLGFYFGTHSNVTTFTIADIFRNRSMSFGSSANLHVQICFQAATLHNAPQFTALSAIERVSIKHVFSTWQGRLPLRINKSQFWHPVAFLRGLTFNTLKTLLEAGYCVQLCTWIFHLLQMNHLMHAKKIYLLCTRQKRFYY